MDEIRFIRNQYVDLRDGISSWITKHLTGPVWYYRPTAQSPNAAWIVPHLVAYEHTLIHTKIQGWKFPHSVTPEFVERYRGGAPGHTMSDKELATPKEALQYIARAKAITVSFLDALEPRSEDAASVDREDVFERYLSNFSHDTEHLGQLKYLAGTYTRLKGE